MKQEKKQISLILDESCYRKIKSLAKENQYSLSGYIRQVLRVHLRELESEDPE